MTTKTDRRTEFDAVASETGANATRYFQEKAKGAGGATDSARVHAIATAALSALHDVIAEHQVTYDEYDALKAWLIRVGEDGEWPLFLDVFIEHAVEASVNAERQGSKGSVEGPFYVPGAPELGADGTMPMRDDEPGTRLDVGGTVTDLDGNPLAGATVELWQCDDNGFYSQFAPGLPEWNLRGTLTTGCRRALPRPHHPARALPDPPRRRDGRLHRDRRAARLAPRAPPPQGLGPGAPAHHHPAVLRGRRVPRHRRRRRREARARAVARREGRRFGQASSPTTSCSSPPEAPPCCSP